MLSLLLGTAVAMGCSSETDGGLTDARDATIPDADVGDIGDMVTDRDSIPETEVHQDVDEQVPAFFRGQQVDVAAAAQWLRARQYLAWNGASKVMPSTQPHGGSRPFVNALLRDSLMADNETHPVGAMGVREIYDDDLSTLRIINLLVKQESSDGEEEWIFIEVTDLNPGGTIPSGLVDPPACMACHAAPADRIISTWPLE